MQQKWVVMLGYAAATLVMTHPFVNLTHLATASFGGDARLMIWTLAWDNHAMLDRAPLFDANVFYPAPSALSYNEHLFGLSLFSLPIYAVTRNPVLAYNVLWLVSFALNALAMHALAVRHTRCALGSFAAGLVYAFTFYKMQHAYGHLSLIWTWLLPLSLLLLERWNERPSIGRAALWGVTVLLQALTSWYLAVIVVVANTIVMVWLFAFSGQGQWSTRLRHLLIVSLAGAAIIAPFAMRYRSLETPSRDEVVSLSADWTAYLVPPENTWVGQLWKAHVSDAPRWIWGEQTLFLGWVAMLLAIVGALAISRERKWRAAGAYVMVILLGLALSFGPSVAGGHERLSLFALLTKLPGISGIRAVARFSVLVTLGVALLAAYGVSAVQRRFGRRGAVVIVALLPLMLSEWFVVDLPGGPPQPTRIPTIYRSPHLATARALVSLPDYRGTDQWPIGADYLYFSTAHWRPIVNGFGRTEPPDYENIIGPLKAFPGPDNANAMRRFGVDYVVVHAARYPNHGTDIIQRARNDPDYELVEEAGTDYLFRIQESGIRNQNSGDRLQTTGPRQSGSSP